MDSRRSQTVCSISFWIWSGTSRGPGSYSAKKALPSPLRGEIVQIGAVRMTQDQQVADEFQILIRPKYFKKMNRKVASLTGIRDSVLREKGVSFPEAAAQVSDLVRGRRASF